MDTFHWSVHHYLRPRAQSFWLWSDDGEAIVSRSGETIVFREELLAVIDRLESSGLPPLGSIVLLMAACRESSVSRCIDDFTVQLARLIAQMDMDWLSEFSLEIDAVRALPAEQRTTPTAKAELAAFVFETMEPKWRTSVIQARAIRNWLADDAPLQLPAKRRVSPQDPVEIIVEIESLRTGLRRIDSEALSLRSRTGLDQEVKPAGVDLAPAQQVRELIAQLTDDVELGGLARLARNLMAIVTLPRKVSEHDELPLGGVSDITNRGPLDRLLLSELAHDDLTLSVRVAVNEALYLRRESPPKTPPQRRAVLLDSGIRMWGLPRVFATAVGMSLAAVTDGHTDVDLFRASGETVVPIDFTTREGTVEHLEELLPDAQPGKSLSAFVDEVNQAEHSTEPVLVTCEEVLDDADFLRELGALELPAIYLITVDRAGGFRMSLRSSRGRKTIREAELKLEELLEPPRKPTLPLIANADPELPAIDLVEPFPFRLSHPFDPQRAVLIPHIGVLAITRDRRLMFWNQTGYGARQLARNLPATMLFWGGTLLDSRHATLLIGRQNGIKLYLVQVDLESGDVEHLPVEPNECELLGACTHGGALFAIHRHEVRVINPSDGAQMQALPLPENAVWNRDRFFRIAGEGWYALSFDGITARFESLTQYFRRDVTLFERAGMDDIFVVSTEGGLFRMGSRRVRQLPHGLGSNGIKVVAVSQSGNYLVLESMLRGRGQRRYCRVEVESGQCRNFVGDPRAEVEPSLREWVSPRNLRKRFTGVAFATDGSFYLFDRRSNRLGVFFDRMQNQICWSPLELPRTETQRRMFGPRELSRAAGYRFRAARWEDGSRVLLDDRGLLHLKSSDRDLPELSFVLDEHYWTAWGSDGTIVGSNYFLGDTRPTENGVAHIKEIIKSFIERLP